jgi:hypothetical protein
MADKTNGIVDDERVAMIITDEISEKNWSGERQADARAKLNGVATFAAVELVEELLFTWGTESAVKCGSA